MGSHRRRGEHLHLQKSSTFAIDVLVLHQGHLPLALHAEPRDPGIGGSGLRAPDPQRRSSAAQIHHLHPRRSVTALLQDGRRRTPRNLHPCLRVDGDDDERVSIKELL